MNPSTMKIVYPIGYCALGAVCYRQSQLRDTAGDTKASIGWKIMSMGCVLMAAGSFLSAGGNDIIGGLGGPGFDDDPIEPDPTPGDDVVPEIEPADDEVEPIVVDLSDEHLSEVLGQTEAEIAYGR